MRYRLLLTGGLFLFGCKSEGGADPLRLDERLRPGQVRAGLVTREDELLGGVTAKGRVGDFKLYNDKVAVVIGQVGFARGYQPYGGTIMDADRVRPAGEPGRSTFGEVISALDLLVMKANQVQVVSDGRDGEAARVRVTGEEGHMPLFQALFTELLNPQKHAMTWEVDYVLEPGAEYVRIEHRLKNTANAPIEIGLPIAGFLFGDGARPFMEGYGFAPVSSGGYGEYYGAVADHVSYLYGRPDSPLSLILTQSGIVVAGIGEGFTLRGGEERTLVHHLVIGDGDLSRAQATWRQAAGKPELGLIAGRVVDGAGRALAGARVHLIDRTAADPARGYLSQALADEGGRFQLAALPGRYALQAVAERYLMGEAVEVELAPASSRTGVEVRLGGSGRLEYRVVDERGRTLPVKLSVRALDAERQALPRSFGETVPGYGLVASEFAIHGAGALVLPAGRYQVWASRGAEYEVAEATVEVPAGGPGRFEARLVRSVASPGWMSTDTHIHSQLSPDSPDLFTMKVASMVTEGLELPISTEHEAIGDFNPAIRELGLQDWIQGVVGSEVTTYVYGHFNAFPLVADPSKPGNGRIDWYGKKPGDTFAAIRANPAEPFIQVNHPRSPSIGGYFSAMGFDRERFVFSRDSDFSRDFDGIEVANGCNLDEIEGATMPDWFAFLNAGERVYATGSTDNHNATGGDMGYPLTWVRMPVDEPKQASIADLRRSFMEGRLIVSCGPFLEIRLGDKEIGDTATVSGEELGVRVHVEAPSWMDVDQLELVVNGQEVRRLSVEAATRAVRFDGEVRVPVPAGRDGWIIARVRGDRAHGIWARGRPSYAFTNPIFLDGDADGRWVMP